MRLFSRLLSKHIYEIPDQYQNSFYLANASLFQIINYFVHKSYQVAFPELVEKVKSIKNDFTDSQARSTTRECIKSLEYCNHFIDVYFPIKRHHGSFHIIRGMRAYHGLNQHNMALGGFMMQEDLKRHTAQGFAVMATYRNACYNIDFAGSYGGLKLNALVYDAQDMKDVVQTYVKTLRSYHGAVDVLEPDLYCGSTEMGYMQEIAEADNVLIMGKPAIMGGISQYETAGPRATVTILKTFLENEKLMKKINFDGTLKDKTFILQGLGKTGQEIGKILNKEGAICVGVREMDTIIYDTGGVPFKALLKHYKKYGTILNFSAKAKESQDSDKIFTELCDILVLAAVERSINCYISENIKAKIILEACNGPISPTADKILLSKPKLLIPSLLASGGHSLMSYLEYLKTTINTGCDLDLLKRIDENIWLVFDEKVKETALGVIGIEEELKLQSNFRAAAYVKAIRKIFDKLLLDDLVEEKLHALNMQ